MSIETWKSRAQEAANMQIDAINPTSEELRKIIEQQTETRSNTVHGINTLKLSIYIYSIYPEFKNIEINHAQWVRSHVKETQILINAMSP